MRRRASCLTSTPVPQRLNGCIFSLNQCGEFTVKTQENKELDRARRTYEKARAVSYTNPSNPEQLTLRFLDHHVSPNDFLQENKELDRARIAYEKARAVLYTRPSDEDLRCLCLLKQLALSD